MRHRKTRHDGLILCLLLALPLVFGNLYAAGESVVRIKVSHARGSSVGTGFAWSQPGYIVTALHVVAGARKINVYSESTRKSSSAEIVAALLEPDLALLRLQRDIGVRPLRHARVDSNSTDEHFVWGYPHDVAKMTRHKVQIVGGLEREPTLASIFKSKSQLRNTVGKQGYPALQSKIIRVDKIQPGHSGAPVVNRRGEVVGIGDGGLRDGLGGLNWAIPAARYLPSLPHSRERIPGRTSVQASLFSAGSESTTDNAPVVVEGIKLHKVWTAPISEISAALDEESVNELKRLNDDALEDIGRSLENAEIDVYEDEETGATFAIPKGMAFEYNAQQQMIVARTNSGAELVIRVSQHESWEDGLDALDSFQRSFDRLGVDWQEDPDEAEEDDWFADEENAVAYGFVSRVAGEPDEDGLYPAELNAAVNLDHNRFLGTAVVLLDTDGYGEQQWYDYYLMELCVRLADFSSF